jgi:hypothetical protein
MTNDTKNSQIVTRSTGEAIPKYVPNINIMATTGNKIKNIINSL